MRNLEHRAFVALHLRIDIRQGDESIKDIHYELELVRDKRIVVDEILLVSILAVSCRQVELRFYGVLLLVVELAEDRLRISILVEDTFLCDVFGVGSLKGDAGLETTENLAVLVGCIGDSASVEHL